MRLSWGICVACTALVSIALDEASDLNLISAYLNAVNQLSLAVGQEVLQ